MSPTDFSFDDVDFDVDTTCVIRNTAALPISPPKVDTTPPTQVPDVQRSESDSDNVSPMIDLDAALGDFNSPSLGPDFASFQTNSLSTRRRLHSSGATGGFSGPGMHYHRRAESAPEMPPIDHSRFGFPRLAGNTAMADVFEEEEEEEEKDSPADRNKLATEPTHERVDDAELSGLGVNVIDEDSGGNLKVRRRTKQQLDSPTANGRSPRSFGKDEAVEIVEADEEPRFSVVTKSSDESTITPSVPSDLYLDRPVSAPIDFALAGPSPAYTTSETASSALSSPDFNKTSFDVPRLHTAASSITDRATLNSREVRPSVDDVPSLTSSSSTALSGIPHRFSGTNRPLGERSSSFSNAVPARTRPTSKRSSLASLSRLVGSSYGEKSKLSIEDHAEPDGGPEGKEKKRGKRISRLMKFWKSKEKLNGAHGT